MSIVTKKPPIKETVGAQYICFNVMDENGEWTENFEPEVERTQVVKTVSVSENVESSDVYASGTVYDTEANSTSSDIEVEVIAFMAETLAKMRGDLVDKGGLILSGGNSIRPFFAYGKVVKLKGNRVKLQWFPKCKLAENTDETSTSEGSFKEQTDKITIKAYPFNEQGHICATVMTDVNWPEGLTEEKFFAQPILSADDLAAVTTTASTTTETTEETGA